MGVILHPLFRIGDAHLFQQLQCLFVGLGLGHLEVPEHSLHDLLADGHGGVKAGHGVLEHAADVGGALVLPQFGHVGAVNDDLAAVHRPHTSHSVQHGGFARAVAADDGDKITFVQFQVQTVQGRFLVDGTGVEGLGNILDLKHFLHPPSVPSLPRALRSTCSSNRARPGTRPPQRRSTV